MVMKEEVLFGEQNGEKNGEKASLALDWESYPILTFEEIPTVEVELINQTAMPSLGAGEATQGPTPAATHPPIALDRSGSHYHV